MNLGDIARMNGNRFSKKIANIDEKNRFTFGETNRRVNRIINALRSRGMKKGDRVAALLYNCNEYLELYFACSKSGIILVPINYRLLPNELTYILNDSEPKVLILDHDFIETVNGIRDQLNFIKDFIVVGDQPAGNDFESFDRVIRGLPDDEPAAEVSDNDIAFIMYTSGTTGYPKGVMVTQKNLMAALFNQFTEVCPSPDEIFFNLPPVYHLAALLTYFVHFYKGCTHIIIKRFDTQAVLEWSERERPTAIHLVPAMQNMIVNFPGVEQYDLSSIRVLFYGASAMPLAQLKQSMDLFKCNFLQFAGLTEVTGHLSALRPEDHMLEGPPEKVKRLGSAGREGLGLEIRIVDERGNECPPGTPGEEIVRGDSVMAGYWKMPEETRQVIKDGWLYTGDICIKDEDGYIYYVDRSKDMINRGGENVYPREVEEVICAHPKVLEAAVIGIPDERLGEEVKAVIVPKNGNVINEDEVIDFCSKNLAGFKRPRTVDFVKELPKNPTGKILKRVLREPYTHPQQ